MPCSQWQNSKSANTHTHTHTLFRPSTVDYPLPLRKSMIGTFFLSFFIFYAICYRLAGLWQSWTSMVGVCPRLHSDFSVCPWLKVLTNVHTHTKKNTCTHGCNTHAHKYIRTHAQKPTHTYMYIRKHAWTPTQTNTHTHTHTHTHWTSLIYDFMSGISRMPIITLLC